MSETFRLKIVSKRQVTLPQRMLNLLNLTEGDELQVDVANHQIQTVRALKSLPTDLFTPEILRELAKRDDSGQGQSARHVEVARLRRRTPAATNKASGG